MILAWTGRLEEGRVQVQALRQHCLERGAERDMMAVAGFLALIDVWRGEFTDAIQNVTDAVEYAEQLGGEDILIIPLTIRALVNAYVGRVRETRADADAVIEGAQRCESARMAEWPTQTLSFLEVSLENYQAALTMLEPLLAEFNPMHGVELMLTWHFPDAVEAMVGLGRLDEAVPLIEVLEQNGARLKRSWLLAVGARDPQHVAGRPRRPRRCRADGAPGHDRSPVTTNAVRTGPNSTTARAATTSPRQPRNCDGDIT